MEDIIKVLVTGSTGQVGNRLVKRLSALGHHVCALDNQFYDWSKTKNVTSLLCDLQNYRKLNAAIINFRPQVVIHLAAIHHIITCQREPVYALESNIIGTQNIISACTIANVEKIFFASSGAVYCQNEDYLDEISTKIDPIDTYALCKYANEKQISYWAKNENKIAVVGRLFNTIASDDKTGHLIPDILCQIKPNSGGAARIKLGNLNSTRDYLHANDVVSAIISLMFGSDMQNNFNIFNICSGIPTKTSEIIDLIAKKLLMTLEVETEDWRIRDIDKKIQVGSNKKILETTNWRPSLNIEQSLNLIIENYFDG